MTRQEGILLFHSMHPDFFENENIRNMPDEWICEEMILSLDKFKPCIYDRKLDTNISFGYYQRDKEPSLSGISPSPRDTSEIKKAVEKVDQDWPQYFTENQRIYCGYVNGKIASFCIIANLGMHNLNGRKVKVGGPGCVGTLPEYRNRGIGLTMVKNVTQILKDEGYDYSYIHYTGVAPWYEKLGYETSIKWTGKGILNE